MIRNWPLTSVKGSCRVTRTGTRSSRDQSGQARILATAASCRCSYVGNEGKASGWLLLRYDKDSILLLVVDARWSNRMFRQPPYSRLAVPSALPRLSAGERDLIEMTRAVCSCATNPTDSGVGERGLFGCIIALLTVSTSSSATLSRPSLGLVQATVTEMETMFAATID